MIKKSAGETKDQSSGVLAVPSFAQTTLRRSKAWVEYAKRHDLMDKPAARLYASYYVCSDPFTVHDFMNPGRTRLTKTAVPNVRPQEHRQSVICRDLVEASTSYGTPSDSQPVTLSRAAHGQCLVLHTFRPQPSDTILLCQL
ncbi:hypothetical protein HPB47_014428 [Ixodes persulcatus]|uniref:Uncharacterized protein n=1 Tax=Ixodes persulcatus TaxID=34615 RepID=A0AC60QX65_IXOPE|nr:hypothetical protein HPB47_014428 [Ixodes persulcatus]